MISVNFKVLQTSVAVRTAGCRKGQWRNKAPKAFSCPDFGAPKIGPKPRSTCQGAILTLPRSHEATQRPTGADTAVTSASPKSVGFRFTEAQIFITATAATPTEILTATMRQIRCPPFRKRFNEYIESEENPMTYINEKHRTRFTLAAKNVHRENHALLSALYLLTADQRLWSCCKHHINNGCVFFENIKLNNCSERAYTLYCAAKDLTLGTKHITVSDLADADLVPPMLFRTICNAMAIRRFGLAAVKEICHD